MRADLIKQLESPITEAMKRFFIIIAVVLSIAIFFGWRDHFEIATEQAKRDPLNAAARELALDSGQARNRAGHGTARTGPDRIIAAKVKRYLETYLPQLYC